MNGKLKAILLLGVMFGLGVFGGMTWQRYQFHHWPMRSTMFAEHRLRRLKKQLNLSADQEKAIGAIFQKAHERATVVNNRVAQELGAIHRDSITAIRQVLTPDQAKEFEKLHQKFHDKHQHIPADDLK